MTGIIFLKLGGSVITDKTQRYSARFDSLERLAGEIRSAMDTSPEMRLVVGHGSGSFGHYAATEALAPHPYPPPAGSGPEALRNFWGGFEEVWYRASQLNRYVVEALHAAGVPVIAFPPSATATAENGAVKTYDMRPVAKALESGLVPVVFGDIVFDPVKGGSILSTEMLMFQLAHELHPAMILLAGLEAAVWADFPARQRKVEKITPSGFQALSGGIGSSHGTDVTGGMRSKVQEMIELVQQLPGLAVQIFSGEEAGNVESALKGRVVGTLITSD